VVEPDQDDMMVTMTWPVATRHVEQPRTGPLGMALNTFSIMVVILPLRDSVSLKEFSICSIHPSRNDRVFLCWEAGEEEVCCSRWNLPRAEPLWIASGPGSLLGASRPGGPRNLPAGTMKWRGMRENYQG